MTARGAVAAIALTMAAAAGCGGGPSPNDTRAELRRWASAVDDVCRATHEDLAARGHAEDLGDLHRVAEGASADVRSAIERIRHVPLPKTAGPRVQDFLAELERIEPQLSEMTLTTVDARLKQIGRLGQRLADATKRFQDRAEAAGLRDCADARQFDAVLNTFTTPVYATLTVQFQLWFSRELGQLRRPTASDFVRDMRRFSNVLKRAERRIGNMYDFRPKRADDAAYELEFALDDYESYLNDLADSLGGNQILTPAGVKQFERDIDELGRELNRAQTAHMKAIGAEPLS